MRRILPQPKQRQLKIIERLSDEKGWIAIDTLADELSISKQTFMKDIDELNARPHPFTIIENKGWVQGHYEEGTNIGSIYRHVINQEPVFQLFEVIFYEETLSVDELADRIYTSTSTSYRLIEGLAVPLEENYGLRIETRPVHLSGPEKAIRSFYNQYFYERYEPFCASVLQDLDLSAGLDFIQAASKQAGRELNFADGNFYRIALAVNYCRYKNGHLLDIPFKDLGPTTHPLWNDLAGHVQSLTQALNIENSLESIQQVFGQFLAEDYYFSDGDFQEAVAKDPILALRYDYLRQTIEKVQECLPDLPVDALKLSWSLQNMASLGSLGFNVVSLLDQSKQGFVREVERLNPELFAYVSKRLLLFGQLMKAQVNEEIGNHYIYSFYTHWTGLLAHIAKVQDKVKVLVLSIDGLYHSQMMKDLIELGFPEQVEVDIHTEARLIPEDLIQSDYDLVITNFELVGIKNKKVVLVNHYPTEEDFHQIYLAIALLNGGQ